MRRLPGKLGVKSLGLTQELHLILPGLNMREGDGIFGVGVKSVDIKRNVRGESDHLDHY